MFLAGQTAQPRRATFIYQMPEQHRFSLKRSTNCQVTSYPKDCYPHLLHEAIPLLRTDPVLQVGEFLRPPARILTLPGTGLCRQLEKMEK